SVVDELESSVAEQQQLLDSTKGELAAAVQAEQQRQAAAAAAAAKAAAEAQQRAAQEQAAARQTRTTAAPRATSSTAPRGGGAPAAPAPTPEPLPASAPRSGAGGAIAAAQTMLGVPYRYGGSTPSGFDCSGLMLWSWNQVGVSLPRTSGAQRAATQRITRDQLQPGDLVFYGNPVSHVGMYVGGGQMIHSPHTGDVVKISPIDRMGGKSMSFGRIG
ncbi:MAG: C40 family peptidase, partial [Microthrixaceae bacterium]